ncbi:MAG: hypothetical protein M3250_04145 [Thermoproteota archaeon]|nr:hypothetical protein [Thermoproteota archaeon]
MESSSSSNAFSRISLTPVQQASANILEDCNGGDKIFSFEQDQSNQCIGFAGCSNADEIIFGFPDM